MIDFRHAIAAQGRRELLDLPTSGQESIHLFHKLLAKLILGAGAAKLRGILGSGCEASCGKVIINNIIAIVVHDFCTAS